MPLIVDIADAVVTELNSGGGGFSQAFTAARSYLPQYELRDMAELHVTVVPRSNQVVPVDRARVSNDVQIDVAVQKRLAVEGEAAAMDALMLLVQEIAARFRGKRMAGAAWVKTVNDPIYAPEHLRELRQFTSVLTFTFRAVP